MPVETKTTTEQWYEALQKNPSKNWTQAWIGFDGDIVTTHHTFTDTAEFVNKHVYAGTRFNMTVVRLASCINNQLGFTVKTAWKNKENEERQRDVMILPPDKENCERFADEYIQKQNTVCMQLTGLPPIPANLQNSVWKVVRTDVDEKFWENIDRYDFNTTIEKYMEAKSISQEAARYQLWHIFATGGIRRDVIMQEDAQSTPYKLLFIPYRNYDVLQVSKAEVALSEEGINAKVETGYSSWMSYYVKNNAWTNETWTTEILDEAEHTIGNGSFWTFHNALIRHENFTDVQATVALINVYRNQMPIIMTTDVGRSLVFPPELPIEDQPTQEEKPVPDLPEVIRNSQWTIGETDANESDWTTTHECDYEAAVLYHMKVTNSLREISEYQLRHIFAMSVRHDVIIKKSAKMDAYKMLFLPHKDYDKFPRTAVEIVITTEGANVKPTDTKYKTWFDYYEDNHAEHPWVSNEWYTTAVGKSDDLLEPISPSYIFDCLKKCEGLTDAQAANAMINIYRTQVSVTMQLDGSVKTVYPAVFVAQPPKTENEESPPLLLYAWTFIEQGTGSYNYSKITMLQKNEALAYMQNKLGYAELTAKDDFVQIYARGLPKKTTVDRPDGEQHTVFIIPPHDYRKVPYNSLDTLCNHAFTFQGKDAKPLDNSVSWLILMKKLQPNAPWLQANWRYTRSGEETQTEQTVDYIHALLTRYERRTDLEAVVILQNVYRTQFEINIRIPTKLQSIDITPPPIPEEEQKIETDNTNSTQELPGPTNDPPEGYATWMDYYEAFTPSLPWAEEDWTARTTQISGTYPISCGEVCEIIMRNTKRKEAEVVRDLRTAWEEQKPISIDINFSNLTYTPPPKQQETEMSQQGPELKPVYRIKDKNSTPPTGFDSWLKYFCESTPEDPWVKNFWHYITTANNDIRAINLTLTSVVVYLTEHDTYTETEALMRLFSTYDAQLPIEIKIKDERFTLYPPTKDGNTTLIVNQDAKPPADHKSWLSYCCSVTPKPPWTENWGQVITSDLAKRNVVSCEQVVSALRVVLHLTDAAATFRVQVAWNEQQPVFVTTNGATFCYVPPQKEKESTAELNGLWRLVDLNSGIVTEGESGVLRDVIMKKCRTSLTAEELKNKVTLRMLGAVRNKHVADLTDYSVSYRLVPPGYILKDPIYTCDYCKRKYTFSCCEVNAYIEHKQCNSPTHFCCLLHEKIYEAEEKNAKLVVLNDIVVTQRYVNEIWVRDSNEVLIIINDSPKITVGENCYVEVTEENLDKLNSKLKWKNMVELIQPVSYQREQELEHVQDEAVEIAAAYESDYEKDRIVNVKAWKARLRRIVEEVLRQDNVEPNSAEKPDPYRLVTLTVEQIMNIYQAGMDRRGMCDAD